MPPHRLSNPAHVTASDHDSRHCCPARPGRPRITCPVVTRLVRRASSSVVAAEWCATVERVSSLRRGDHRSGPMHPDPANSSTSSTARCLHRRWLQRSARVPRIATPQVRLDLPWPRSSICCPHPDRTRSRCSTRSGCGQPKVVARCTRTRRRRRWPWRPVTMSCWPLRRVRARASSLSPASCSPATRVAGPCGPRRSRRWSPRSSSTSSISSVPGRSGWRQATRRSTRGRRCSCARPRSLPTRP